METTTTTATEAATEYSRHYEPLVRYRLNGSLQPAVSDEYGNWNAGEPIAEAAHQFTASPTSLEHGGLVPHIMALAAKMDAKSETLPDHQGEWCVEHFTNPPKHMKGKSTKHIALIMELEVWEDRTEMKPPPLHYLADGKWGWDGQGAIESAVCGRCPQKQVKGDEDEWEWIGV